MRKKSLLRMLVMAILVMAMLFGLAAPVALGATALQERAVADLVRDLNNKTKAIFQAILLYPTGNFELQLAELVTVVGSLETAVVAAGYPVSSQVFKALDDVEKIAGAFASSSVTSSNPTAAMALVLRTKVAATRAVFNAIKPEPETPTPPAQPEVITVNPTHSTVYVNGKAVVFEAYLINDENYFKLRDLAFVLNGTEKQFSAVWDAVTMQGTLTSGEAYVPDGNELAPGDGSPKQASFNEGFAVILDGVLTEIRAYLIMDNNFVRIRDILRLFDIGWTYDQATQDIGIITSAPYAE